MKIREVFMSHEVFVSRVTVNQKVISGEEFSSQVDSMIHSANSLFPQPLMALSNRPIKNSGHDGKDGGCIYMAQ